MADGAVHLTSSRITPVLNGATDPTAGSGVSAPIGWLYYNTSTGSVWHKTGSGDTAWARILDLTDIHSALFYKGVIDCSGNPNYPAANSGDVYVVSVAGKIGGASGIAVEVGDMIICKVDSSPAGDQATVGANWNIVQTNIDGAVTGPASAVSGNFPAFDGISGKIIKDSGYNQNSFTLRGNVTAGVWTMPSVSSSYPDLTIGSGQYRLYNSSDSDETTIDLYTIAGGTFTIPDDGVSHYIVANYNGGTPVVQLISDVTLINQADVVPIFTCFNLSGASTILYLSWDEMAKGLANKLCHRLVKTERYKVQPGGFVLGEVATRLVAITAGSLFYGGCHIDLPAVQSDVSGQYIAFYSHVAGVWTRTTGTQYNNTQYDNGTNLVTLSNNKYAVNWVYRGFSEDPVNIVERPIILMGGGDYTLAEAIASAPPASIPNVVSNFCFLVGRIIVKKNDTTATQIDSALVEALGLSGITDHNGLSNLQGGTVGEYYHFTAAQHTEIAAISGLSIYQGFVSRIGSPSYICRTFSGVSNRITVTNGDGISGDPVIDIDTSLFPSPAAGDVGKGLVATGANTATWSTISAADANAVHVNASGEIHAVTEKTSLSTSDVLILEDSAATWAKRRVAVSNLVRDSIMTFTDNTTGDVSISAHGFCPKAPNDTGKFLRGDSTWAALTSSGDTNTKRQTVLSGGVDSTTGLANFLSAGTGLAVTLSASSTDPVVLSWANGFGASPYNYESSYTTNQTNLFSSLTANAVNFLYIDNNGSGTLTAGSTIYTPVYDTVFNSTDAQAVLSPFEGTNGTTSYTDTYGKLWTFTGTTKLSNVQKLYNSTTSLQLNTDGYAQISFPDIRDSSTASMSWTIEMFIRPTDATAATVQTIFCGGDARYTFNLGISTAGKLVLYLSSNATSFDLINGTAGNSTLSDATWYHIAIVCNGVAGTIKTYLNGTEETNLSISGSTAVMPSNDIRLGATYTGNTLYFTGYMEGLRYSPYARYTANFTAPSAVFTAEDLYYFDINKMTMYRGQPGNWTKTYRLFVGEAATNASAVSSAVTYAIRGKCLIREAAIPANGTNTALYHNIGCKRYRASLKLRCIAYDAPFYPNLVITVFGERFAAASYQNFNGSTFSSMRRNYVYKTVGVYGVAALDYTGSTINITSANWKYVLEAERDF